MRTRTEAYKEWSKQHGAASRAKNPELHRERVRRSRAKALENDPEYYKKIDLKRMYNVTLEWYKDTLEKQNYCCAICKKHESQNTVRCGKTLMLSVDHCHDTGEVRGLLCNSCNRAIGMLGHSVSTLEEAIGYLTRYKEQV
jgi:hypothetical protein